MSTSQKLKITQTFFVTRSDQNFFCHEFMIMQFTSVTINITISQVFRDSDALLMVNVRYVDNEEFIEDMLYLAKH